MDNLTKKILWIFLKNHWIRWVTEWRSERKKLMEEKSIDPIQSEERRGKERTEQYKDVLN